MITNIFLINRRNKKKIILMRIYLSKKKTIEKSVLNLSLTYQLIISVFIVSIAIGWYFVHRVKDSLT